MPVLFRALRSFNALHSFRSLRAHLHLRLNLRFNLRFLSICYRFNKPIAAGDLGWDNGDMS